MKSGNINFIDTELTNEQFASLGYPALYILKNSSNIITKFIIFDLNGVRTDYDTSSGGGTGVTEEWVNAQISTAIAGLQDNRLEYNEFSDFPAIGDETKFYIDLSEDKIYIWDATFSTYKNQSWDTAIIASIQASIASAQMAFQNLENSKLNKETYTGTAQDLKNEIDGKASISHTHNISSITNLQTALDNINNDINNLEGINYIWSPTNRTLTLFDRGGTQLSQVYLVSLDNEGTDLRYNATTLSLELYNADNELLDSIPVSSFIGSVGTQLQLNSNQLQLRDSQGNILSTVTFAVSNIDGLQTVLDSKIDKGGYEGTAQDLKNSIDNMQIGGRNYVLDSERERVFSAIKIGKLNGFTGGETITLSFEAKYVGVDGLAILILNGGIEYDGTQLLRINVTSPNYTKYSQTITLPASLDNLRLVGWIGGNGTGTGYAKKFKVEKGNKATDWTPAPEDKQDSLQDITGNIGVGKTDASATEKLDVNGNVKATGFKTSTGTATQALTANGGVFDLNTKADLVGGKVPKTQSQPSTMVMDNSTYVITFTDATGAVQTIDLPLESLFKDANYNSSTKSLIVTLQDGTTRTIPLTDLVDLPEIVLATTNPAVTHTTGQKVYFNTSLGKVWFNVSGAWTYAGNLISDSEKANITIAYNHSQATGNPHNTKLEELSDVSGDATTIIDTDVILKKESGGFWKKITFANFKNWFTNELAKKINIGLDTVFNFKNISAMTLTDFRSINPNLETIYFTEEQNGTGWQQIRHSPLLYTGSPALIETPIIINNETHLQLYSDSTFNLIDVENTKIIGIFENDFVIITFSSDAWRHETATDNQWVKFILKINGVQAAVSPVFSLTESALTPERISHSFALNVTAEMVTHGATLHVKSSTSIAFESPSITVARVHKSTSANL